jgi:sugar-specific transcriptional regulator TrmB
MSPLKLLTPTLSSERRGSSKFLSAERRGGSKFLSSEGRGGRKFLSSERRGSRLVRRTSAEPGDETTSRAQAKELLRSLGLSPYEAEVYDALVRYGSARVRDLARRVKVPRPMIYTALKRFVELGIVSETKGKVAVFAAISPNVAFRDLLAREQKLIQKKNEGVRQLAQLYRHPEPNHDDDTVQFLRCAEAIGAIDDLARQAESEILFWSRIYPEQGVDDLRRVGRERAALLKRGVRLRCLYEASDLADPARLAHVRQLTSKGQESKGIDSLPLNMHIYDNRVVVLIFATSRRDFRSYIFRQPGLVQVLRESFEVRWAAGTPIP